MHKTSQITDNECISSRMNLTNESFQDKNNHRLNNISIYVNIVFLPLIDKAHRCITCDVQGARVIA